MGIVAGAFALAAVLAGCQSEPVGSPAATAEPDASETTAPVELAHPTPDAPAWKAIAFLDQQVGPNTVGTYTRTAEILYVDLLCLGGDSVDIEIAGVGTFPVPCSADGSAQSHNEFDVSFVDTYSVSIQAADTQKWSITLSEPA